MSTIIFQDKENFGDGPRAGDGVVMCGDAAPTTPVAVVCADAPTPVAVKRGLQVRTPGRDITALVNNTADTPVMSTRRTRPVQDSEDDEIVFSNARFAQQQPPPQPVQQQQERSGSTTPQVYHDAETGEGVNNEEIEVFFGTVTQREATISEQMDSNRRKTLVIYPSPRSTCDSPMSVDASADTDVSNYLDANTSHNEYTQDTMAIKIQALYRGWEARRALLTQHATAARLQALVRAYLARKQYSRAKGQIVVVQACVRAYLARQRFAVVVAAAAQKKAEEDKEQERQRLYTAATKVQKVYRGYMQCKVYQQVRRAIVVIQAAWCGYRARQVFQKQKSAIVVMQSVVRMFLAKKVLQQRKDEAAKAALAKEAEMTQRMKSLYDQWQQKIAARKSSSTPAASTTSTATTTAPTSSSSPSTSHSSGDIASRVDYSGAGDGMSGDSSAIEVSSLPSSSAMSTLEQKKQRLARIRAERLKLQSKNREKTPATSTSSNTENQAANIGKNDDDASGKPFTKPQKVNSKKTSSTSRQNDALCQQNTLNNAHTQVQMWGRHRTSTENASALSSLGLQASPQRAGNVVAVIANHKPRTDYAQVAASRPYNDRRIRWRDAETGEDIQIPGGVYSPDLSARPRSGVVMRREEGHVFEYANEQPSPVFITTKPFGRITQYMIQNRMFYPDEL